MKTPLGTKVDLVPGHTVLDGDPAPLPWGHSNRPLFGPCLLWPVGQMAAWFKMAFGMEVGLSPGDFVLDGDTAPNFRPMSVVAKQLNGL